MGFDKDKNPVVDNIIVTSKVLMNTVKEYWLLRFLSSSLIDTSSVFYFLYSLTL